MIKNDGCSKERGGCATGGRRGPTNYEIVTGRGRTRRSICPANDGRPSLFLRHVLPHKEHRHRKPALLLKLANMPSPAFGYDRSLTFTLS